MAITREGRICSFCGEPGGPGTDLGLIGGLGAQICARCVDDFHGILHDEDRLTAARGPMPWERMDDAELLATLPQILASAEQNTAFAHEWVDLLRSRNISWADAVTCSFTALAKTLSHSTLMTIGTCDAATNVEAPLPYSRYTRVSCMRRLKKVRPGSSKWGVAPIS